MSLKQSALIIFLLAVGVYLPSIRNGFVWDDEEQVVNNPFVQDFQYVGELFSGSTFGGAGASSLSGGYYKPLMSVWFLFNWTLWNGWAGGFHLTQAILHGMNGVLVFLLLRKVFEEKGGEIQRWAPFFAGLLFAVHPVAVEAVSYVSSAQDVLVLFFALSSVLLVVYRTRFGLGLLNALFLSCGLAFLGLLSKESAVLAPFFISAYLVIFEKEWQKKLGYFLLLLLPVLGSYALLRFGVAQVGLRKHEIIPIVQASFLKRMMTVPEVLFQHIRTMVLPLHLYIGHHQVVEKMSFIWGLKLAVVVGALIFFLWQAWKKKSKAGWFFFVWTLLSVGLVSNIYPLDMTFAERWVYMPLVGFVGLLGSLYGHYLRDRRVQTGMGVILLILAGRNVVRQAQWRNGLTLYAHDAQFAENAFDLENNLGVELYREGKLEEAKVHFEKSIELQPQWWTHYNNLGAYYQNVGDLDRAIPLYEQSVEKGDYYLAYLNLAELYVIEQREELRPYFEKTIRAFPNNPAVIQLYRYALQEGLLE